MNFSQLSEKLIQFWKKKKNLKKKKTKKKLVFMHLLYRAIFEWYFQVKFKCSDIFFFFFFFIKLLGESIE